MNSFIKLLLLIAFVFPLVQDASGAITRNENVTYHPNIKTILFYKKGFEMAQPVMHLREAGGLELSFDDLDGDSKPYKYTIFHCESDWTTSAAMHPDEYIEGNTEGLIENFEYSYNTLVNYTHYRLSFPSVTLGPKVSGNYLLVVYTDTPDSPSFTRRFMVVERTPLGVTGMVHQANNPEIRFAKQEVDFEIRYNGFPVYEPVRQIRVVVTQNDRWDNAIQGIAPRFIRNESLDYNYDDVILFNGGNEFRNFDIKSLKYNSERISTIDKSGDVTRVVLLNDERKTFRKYTTEADLNGRMLVKNEDNVQNSDIEADYVKMNFSLPVDAMRANGNLYLLGALTGWQLDDHSRMEFDFESKSYVKELLLKQGYYNYIYVFRDNTSGKTDETITEGNHWETENEYTIWVYFRDPGGLFDRLIGVQNLNSTKQVNDK